MKLRHVTFLVVLLASCDDRPVLQFDPTTTPTPPGPPDAGLAAPVPAVPGSCLGTMAFFKEGLLEDLEAVLDRQWRDRNNQPAVEGVFVAAGYGVDIAMLTTGFSVGRESVAQTTPTAGDPTLSFGGWKTSWSTGRDPKALRAAEQLWSGLGAGSEQIQGSRSTRMTPGKRVACGRVASASSAGDSLAVHCVLTGFLSLDAAEIPCD